MTQTVGLRERKKLATRRALRQVALRLVAERGLANVTIAEIADAADVSERTFFNHFPCKEDALIGVDPDRVHDLRAALAAEPQGIDPLAALRAVLGTVAAMLQEHRGELLLQFDVLRDNPELRAREMAAFARYEAELVLAVAARSGTDPQRDIYPLLAARVAVAALRTALTLWRSARSPQSLPDLVGMAFDQIAQGLPPPR